MIDWDSNTARRRRITSIGDARFWQIAVVIAVLLAMLAGYWYLLNQNPHAPRNIDQLDIINAGVNIISDIEVDGIHIFHGSLARSGEGGRVSVIYSDELGGSEIAEMDLINAERAWVKQFDSTPGTVRWYTVRNAVIGCSVIRRCEQIAFELSRVTVGEVDRESHSEAVYDQIEILK
jgi:hypothetical protein